MKRNTYSTCPVHHSQNCPDLVKNRVYFSELNMYVNSIFNSSKLFLVLIFLGIVSRKISPPYKWTKCLSVLYQSILIVQQQVASSGTECEILPPSSLPPPCYPWLLGNLLSSRVSWLSGSQMFGPPLLRSSGLLSVVDGDTSGPTPS